MKGVCRSFVAFIILFSVVTLMFHRSSVSTAAVGEEAVGRDKITRFLVLGCDHSTRLTDSILVVSINETKRETRILQIPRDTYAEYTKKSYKKLNGAMQGMGASDLKRFLSHALGIKIDYYVILKLDFFKSLVDAIGGVDVMIERDMEYSDPAQNLKISLKAGRTHLNGDMAEQFVRYRSGYVNADLGRLDAQKLFLSAFAKQCQSLTLPQLLHVTALALTGVQTDIGLPSAIRTVGILRSCDASAIPMATLSGQAVKGKSGAWYYVLNREAASEMVEKYMMSDRTKEDALFDPDRVFDRPQNEEFHRIYTAKKLPIS